MRYVALKEVADINMGTAPPGSTYNTEGNGMPMIAGAGDYGEVYPNPKKWTTSPTSVTKIGDLIVCVRATIGDLNWSDRPYCLGRGVAGIRADDESADIRYLAYFIEYKKHVLQQLGTGSTFPAIRRSDLENFEVPLHHLDHQKYIASILDKTSAVIRKRQQTIELSEQYVRSVFLEMFEKDKEDSCRRLDEVCDLYSGSTLPKGNDFKGQKDGYLLLKVSDMNLPGNEVYINESQEWVDAAESKYINVPAGTVIFPKRGAAIGTNKKRIIKRASILDPNLMGVHPKDNLLSSTYLYHWFQCFDLLRITSGSSVPQLNKKDLNPLHIYIPKKEEIIKFDSHVKATDKIFDKLRQSLNEARLLFGSLSKQAFQGQLYS